MVKNLPASAEDAGDAGLIPGSGRSPGVGNDNPLCTFYLENPKDRGAWRATAHRVSESQTPPSTAQQWHVLQMVWEGEKWLQGLRFSQKVGAIPKYGVVGFHRLGNSYTNKWEEYSVLDNRRGFLEIGGHRSLFGLLWSASDPSWCPWACPLANILTGVV